MTAPTWISLRGVPRDLVRAERTPVRALAIVGGGLLAAAAWASGAQQTAPLLWLGGIALGELRLWRRNDRPVGAVLDEHGVHVVDGVAGAEHRAAWADVTAVAWHRRDHDDHVELALVLWSDARPVLGLRLRAPPDSAPGAGDIPVNALNTVFGGYGGLLPGLVPRAAAVRQPLRIDTPTVRALRGLVSRNAGTRPLAVRLWRGVAPALDAFGLHVGEPDATLWLPDAGPTVRTSDGDRGLDASAPTLHRAVREGVALRPSTVDDDAPLGSLIEETIVVPLRVIRWPNAAVAFPCEHDDPSLPTTALDAATWHTHLAEGGALVAWLATRFPAASPWAVLPGRDPGGPR